MPSESNFFSRLTQIKPSEFKAAIVAFFFVFILMSSYMIMKPVRDALPSDWGGMSLPQQWTYTFILSTIAVSVYNVFASSVSLRKLVPGVFIFFAISFVSIYIAFQGKLLEVGTLGKIFYTWSSVFSLFHISVFWSFISQHYNKEQSKRVFGFINTGASAGAIFGPLMIVLLSSKINEENILLVTAGVLLLTLPLIAILNAEFAKKEKPEEQRKQNLSPNPFAGFIELLTHKRLCYISAFVFMFTGAAAFLYFAQTELLSDFSRPERKQLLGSVELATNILTIIIGMFATNRIARRFGMPTTLSLVPFTVCALLLIVAMHPAIILVLVMQVVRRTGNYAITRPAREILFTAVDREARFKTKPIIDVAVYRGGDVCWIWLILYLSESVKLGLPAIFGIAAAVCFLWAILAIYLGRAHENDPDEDHPDDNHTNLARSPK